MNSKTEELIEIFKPNGADWLGVLYKNDEELTYHHIIKASDGGARNYKNGALLCTTSHRFIHLLENTLPEYYDKFNTLFKFLNSTQMPPDENYYMLVSKLRDESINALENTIEAKQKKKKKHKLDKKLVLVNYYKEVFKYTTIK